MKPIVLGIQKGKVKPVNLLGLRDGGATLAPFNRKVPPEVAQKVRGLEKGIRAGKIKVPWLAKKLID